MTLAAIKVGDSVQQALDSFFGFVPNILGFLVILLIGFIIAKVAKKAIATLLQKVGLDRALHNSDAGQYVERVSPGASPAHLIGVVVFWFVFLFAISAAIGALKIPALSEFIAQVQAFLPNIIVAAIIFVLAAALAGVVGGAAHKLMGDTPTGKIVRAVVPGLILAIGTFMVLDQLNIAPQIVTITYAALLGMLALAGALAFGLGGREVANRMLSDAYDRGRTNTGRFRRDQIDERDRARAERRYAATEPSPTAGPVATGAGPANGPTTQRRPPR
jgi:mechanosensitive ion channel-like protein